MKRILTAVLIQTILVFTFLFDPSATNIGGDIITLPPFALGVATILGNVVWVYGLLCLLAVVIFGWLSLEEQSDKLDTTTNDAIATSGMSYSMKGISSCLVFTSYTIYFVALGSGFWFTGIAGVLATWTMGPYRNKFWEQMQLREGNQDRLDKLIAKSNDS